MKKIYIALFLNFILVNNGLAQNKNLSYKLHELDLELREIVDTLLIFEIKEFPFNYFDVVYLTKKDDTINLFKYAIDIRRSIVIPSKLKNKLWDRVSDFAGNRRYYNRNFSVVNISPNESKNVWNNVMALNPREWKDDNDFEMGCPIIVKDANGKDVKAMDKPDHQGYYILTMVTKDQIISKEFYGVKYLEKTCPGWSVSRGSILRVEQLLSQNANFSN